MEKADGSLRLKVQFHKIKVYNKKINNETCQRHLSAGFTGSLAYQMVILRGDKRRETLTLRD